MEEKIKEIIRERVYGYLNDSSFRVGTLAERISDKSYFTTGEVVGILMNVCLDAGSDVDHADAIKNWVKQ